MTSLQKKDNLQISLLDRLTDDQPEISSEPRDKRGFSQAKLRENILRDLNWLFNSSNLATVENLEEFPEVESSVLNYGMPDFTGHTVSGINVPEIERLLKKAIFDFEPRIIRRSIKVKLNLDEKNMGQNAMTFDIEGELWAEPLPLQIYLRTMLDLDVGDVKVYDYSGSS